MPLKQLYPPSIVRRQRGDDDDDDDDDDGSSRHRTNTSSGITGSATGTSGSSTPTSSASIGNGAKRGANGGAIAGGVIAGLVMVGVLVFLWWRRRVRGRYHTTAVLDNESLVEHKNHSHSLNTASSGGAGVMAAGASAVHRNVSSQNHQAYNFGHSGPESLGTRTSRQMTVANPDTSMDSRLSTALGDIKAAKSAKSGSTSATSRKSTEAAGPSSSQRDSEAPSTRHDSDNTSISSRLSNPYSLFDNPPAESQGTTANSNPPSEKRRSAPVHLSANDYPIPDDRSTSSATTTTDIFELQRRVEALQRENEMLHLDAAPPAYQ